MIDIKEKIKELCKGHIEDSIVESFLNKYSASYFYDDFVKDMFSEGDNIDINDDYTLSVWKFDDEMKYTLLDYSIEENDSPEELNEFILKNSNPNQTNIAFG